MLTVSIVSIILMTFAIFYSLCRIPSRTYCHINSKSIVFVHKDDSKHFEDLFLNGDIEGVHRILQVLQQRELLEIIEMDYEIYLVNHNPASVENFRTVPRGLCVSNYDPMEDLRHLRSLNIDFRYDNPDAGRYVTGNKPVPIKELEEIDDDLFVSDFDILEALRNLTTQTPFVFASATSS